MKRYGFFGAIFVVFFIFPRAIFAKSLILPTMESLTQIEEYVSDQKLSESHVYITKTESNLAYDIFLISSKIGLNIIVDLKEFIGRGSQKTIRLGYWLNQKRHIVYSHDMSSHEISVCKSLQDHGRIPTFLWVIPNSCGEHKNRLFTYFQLYYPHSLYDLYSEKHEDQKKDIIQLSYKEKWRIAKDLVRALKGIHDLGILHRDIKPANIMLTESVGHWTGIFIDFGLSMFINQFKERRSQSGTLIFNSPRLWRSCEAQDSEECGLFNPSDDVWALGMSLFYLKFGKLPPWSHRLGDTMSLTEDKIDQYECIQKLEEDKDDILGQVIWHFLRPNPEEMWSLEEALDELNRESSF